MADRDTSIPGNQILDDSITQSELDLTNTPTDGDFIRINMPAGDMTAVNLNNVNIIATMQTNIVLNAFRVAINGSLTQFNMVDGIVDEYENENSIDNPNSTNEEYDSADDFYKSSGILAPFAHFKMNDNLATTNVVDDGSGANDGTGQANTDTLTITGKINEALDFNGTTDFINADTMEADIRTDTTGSIAFWINPDVNTGNFYIFSVANASAPATHISIFLDSSGFLNIHCNDNGTIKYNGRTTSIVTPNGSWTNVVVTHDGVSPKIYINGVQESLNFTVSLDKTLWYGDLAIATNNARIGCRRLAGNPESAFFNGQLDDIRYYQNTVLSQSDIDDIYNSGSGTESGGRDNMTLISDPFTAEAQPDNVRIVIFEEDVDSITLNTDLKVFTTRDAGQTFTTDFTTDDKLDITSHGFSNDDRIMVTSSSQDLPAGLDSATVYYVINATTNDFELSLTSSGSAIDITDNGTGTHTAKQVSEITLINDGEYESGKNILTGSIDISGQTSGTSMEYYIQTLNSKDLNIHGIGLSWD